MRTTSLLFSTLAAVLMSAGAVTAYAAEGDFYDPSNAASPTGKTIGHELYRTIGCPGRILVVRRNGTDANGHVHRQSARQVPTVFS